MSGRRLRRLLLLALAVGVGYWIYTDRPSVTGIVDSLTNPLMRSKAAVEESERNRVVGEATSAISDQTDTAVGALKEGMKTSEVRDLVGNADKVEEERVEGALQQRWTYAKLKRVLIVKDGRVTSVLIQ